MYIYFKNKDFNKIVDEFDCLIDAIEWKITYLSLHVYCYAEHKKKICVLQDCSYIKQKKPLQ